MLQAIITLISDVAALTKRVDLLLQRIVLTDEFIVIRQGKTALTLYDDGKLKLTVYSTEDNRYYELTNDDLVKAVKATKSP
jgi:hypothetical protein